MGRFDVDLVGNYAEGVAAKEGLRDASKKREAESAYDAAQKKAETELVAGLKQAQASAQGAANSEVESQNSIRTADAALRDTLALRDAHARTQAAPVQTEQSGSLADITNQALEGKSSSIGVAGLSLAPTQEKPAQAPFAPAGLAQAKTVAPTPLDPYLMRVKQHELTAKYLRESGQYDLANAELDKSVAAHGQYLANTQAQRIQLAGGFARALESGNIGQATDMAKKLTGMVNDGHEIQSLTPNKDGTFSVVYGGEGAKPVNVTKAQLINLARGFATPDINKHYEEVMKSEKARSEISENESTIRLNNAKASGFLGTSGGKGGAAGEAAIIQVANRLMADDDTLTFDQALRKAKAGSAKDIEVSHDNNAGTTQIVDRANGQLRIYNRKGDLTKTIALDPKVSLDTTAQPEPNPTQPAPKKTPAKSLDAFN